jgi:hypothetical protein
MPAISIRLRRLGFAWFTGATGSRSNVVTGDHPLPVPREHSLITLESIEFGGGHPPAATAPVDYALPAATRSRPHYTGSAPVVRFTTKTLLVQHVSLRSGHADGRCAPTV